MAALSIPVLAAPTAAGKTAVSLRLAKRFPLEIISADAMMVYQGMDIGTAKPSPLEQALVRHHMIDLVTPDMTFSVADYVPKAEAVIADVVARGKIPIVVGGTGFYIEALVSGLPTTPPADHGIQAELWALYERTGLDSLLKQLAEHSPLDAERSQRNPRRVIRALDIIRQTGRAPSEFPRSQPAFHYDVVTLLPTLDTLMPRIQQRTEHMFHQGLIEEVTSLLRDYPNAPTAKQAIGYKEVVDYLAGSQSLTATKEAIILATRRYAKRQRTWFKRQPYSQLPLLADAAYRELGRWLDISVSSS